MQTSSHLEKTFLGILLDPVLTKQYSAFFLVHRGYFSLIFQGLTFKSYGQKGFLTFLGTYVFTGQFFFVEILSVEGLQDKIFIRTEGIIFSSLELRFWGHQCILICLLHRGLRSPRTQVYNIQIGQKIVFGRFWAQFLGGSCLIVSFFLFI